MNEWFDEMNVYIVVAKVDNVKGYNYEPLIIAANSSDEACEIVRGYAGFTPYHVRLLDRTDNDYDIECTIKQAEV